MTELRIFTIGHSNHSLERFLKLLSQHDINAVADVRSAPYSRFCPQFNRDVLTATLRASGIGYSYLGRELGGRSDDPAGYEGGQIQYDLTLLVAPELVATGVYVVHILAGGELETHERTMDRLLVRFGPSYDLFQPREELLARAIAGQAQRVAYAREGSGTGPRKLSE